MGLTGADTCLESGEIPGSLPRAFWAKCTSGTHRMRGKLGGQQLLPLSREGHPMDKALWFPLSFSTLPAVRLGLGKEQDKKETLGGVQGTSLWHSDSEEPFELLKSLNSLKAELPRRTWLSPIPCSQQPGNTDFITEDGKVFTPDLNRHSQNYLLPIYSPKGHLSFQNVICFPVSVLTPLVIAYKLHSNCPFASHFFCKLPYLCD